MFWKPSSYISKVHDKLLAFDKYVPSFTTAIITLSYINNKEKVCDGLKKNLLASSCKRLFDPCLKQKNGLTKNSSVCLWASLEIKGTNDLNGIWHVVVILNNNFNINYLIIYYYILSYYYLLMAKNHKMQLCHKLLYKPLFLHYQKMHKMQAK